MTLAEEAAPLGPVLGGIPASSPAWRVLVDGWPQWRLWRPQWKRMGVPKERRAAWRRLHRTRLRTWRAEAQRRVDEAWCWDTARESHRGILNGLPLAPRLLHGWNDATNERGSPRLVRGYAARRGYWRGKIRPLAVTFRWAHNWDTTIWPAPAVRQAIRTAEQAVRTWLLQRSRTVVEFDGDGVPCTPPVFELDLADWATAKDAKEWRTAAETVARVAPHLLTKKDRRLLGMFQVIRGEGSARGKLQGSMFDLEWRRAA